tara:strand:- start:3673 stop:4392 length:720 start_codon:yes stop_codon:yes gene_type:complete
MSQLDYLSVGMGGPTILMSDGDIANNIRGYALQALEDCVFSQIDLDQTPSCGIEKKLQITAVTIASEEFTLSADDIATLKVGDKVLLNWGGVNIPLGTVKDSQGRPTEFKDSSIYFIQAIDSASYEVKLEETSGAGVITLDDVGTLYGAKTWIAKLSDQNFSHGTFTRNASANDRTHEIVGNVDGRIFRTDDDSGLQVNMFDTTGTATVGDVTIARGMTVYLPITDVTLTTGACLIYTK